jgi:hypothetical protein
LAIPNGTAPRDHPISTLPFRLQADFRLDFRLILKEYVLRDFFGDFPDNAYRYNLLIEIPDVFRA